MGERNNGKMRQSAAIGIKERGRSYGQICPKGFIV